MTRDEIIAKVIGTEGGYVNNPADPGGATKYGITQRYLTNARKSPQFANLPASVADITAQQAHDLYAADQWQVIKGDSLPPAVALLAFDCAVNAGPGTAANILETALGIPADGVIGPHVIAASAAANPQKLAAEFAAQNAFHYAKIYAMGERQFMLGWMRRVITMYTASITP